MMVRMESSALQSAALPPSMVMVAESKTEEQGFRESATARALRVTVTDFPSSAS